MVAVLIKSCNFPFCSRKEVELLKLTSTLVARKKRFDANLSFVSVSRIFHAMAPIFFQASTSFKAIQIGALEFSVNVFSSFLLGSARTEEFLRQIIRCQQQ